MLSDENCSGEWMEVCGRSSSGIDRGLEVDEVFSRPSKTIPVPPPPVERHFDPENPLQGDYMIVCFEGSSVQKDSAVFSIKGAPDSKFECTLDPEECLKGSGTWKQNGRLLTGHTQILKRSLFLYLDAIKRRFLKTPHDKCFEVDLTKKNNLVIRPGDLVPTIYFAPFKDRSHEKIFEEILLEGAVPWVKGDQLNDCVLVTMHNCEQVELAPEGLFYTRIKQILEENYRQIEDPIEDLFLRTYLSHIDEFQGKNFIARFENQPWPFYRVRILEDVSTTEREDCTVAIHLRRKFRVSYIDIGLTRILSLMDFVCIGSHSSLPPLMVKLPPQVVNCYMHHTSPTATQSILTRDYQLMGDVQVTVKAQVVDNVPVKGCDPFVIICNRIKNGATFRIQDSLNQFVNKVYKKKQKERNHQRTHGDVVNLAEYYLDLMRESRVTDSENNRFRHDLRGVGRAIGDGSNSGSDNEE